jgi:hypothetical protein
MTIFSRFCQLSGGYAAAIVFFLPSDLAAVMPPLLTEYNFLLPLLSEYNFLFLLRKYWVT